MAQRIKRKLRTVNDPTMTSTSAVSRRPAAKKPAAAAAKPGRPAAKKPAAAAAKPGRKPAGTKPAAVHPADKKFNNDRAKVLADRRKKDGAVKTGKTAKEMLAERMKGYNDRVEAAKKAGDLQRSLLVKRAAVAEKNLKAKQAASKKNLEAKLKARQAFLKAKKPVIKDGKVMTPKVDSTKFKAAVVKPKVLPMPRIVDGKIVTKKRTAPVQHSAAAKKGAKAAAKTKASGRKVAAV